MYNRILNRPMFKLGGKTVDAQGTGITSGLDVPRQGYADQSFVQKLSEIDVSVPESTRKRAFWSGIGQGFGSNPRTLGEALNTAVGARDQILGPAEAKAAERRFELDKTGVTGEFERETLTILQKMGDENKLKVQALANKATATAQKIEAVKAKYRKSDGSLDETDANYRAEIDVITSGFNLEKEALGLAKILIQTTYPDLSSEAGIKALAKQIMTIVGIVQAGAGKATGGRVGYQLGATNQGVQPMQASLNVDETIQTPTETIQEDVAVQEKIQPSVNMTYQEFRAKMPPQVDDEIVQLIYYNQDAFADFAQIKTQDEVYAFNNKWGVSLVLPFDTEIT
jgi:hypothetical protein